MANWGNGSGLLVRGQKALILRWLVKCGKPATPKGVAEALGLNKASVRRSLQELQRSGLVKSTNAQYTVLVEKVAAETEEQPPRGDALQKIKSEDRVKEIASSVEKKNSKAFLLRANLSEFEVWESEADREGATTTQLIREAIRFYLVYRDTVKHQILMPNVACDQTVIEKSISALSQKIDDIGKKLETSARVSESANPLAKDEIIGLIVTIKKSGELGKETTLERIQNWLVEKKPALSPYLLANEKGMSALQEALIEMQARGELTLTGNIIAWR